MTKQIDKIQTVYGRIENNVLIHDGKREPLTVNRFKRDINYTYIQILRSSGKIYIVDAF